MSLLDHDTKIAIRRGYNCVVTEKRAAFVPLPSFDLLFLLAVDASSGAFKAGLVRWSDCRFEGEGTEPSELPQERLYAASFDFLNGLKASVNENRLDEATAAAVRAVHEELRNVFGEVAASLMRRADRS